MRILVTRPRQDAQPLAAELRERGHDVLVAPMLTIEAQAAPADIETTLAQAQAILVTSLNGMRRLSEITTRRDLTIAAVGESTARLARESGFCNIAAAGGTAEQLAALAGARFQPNGGPLVHVSGAVIAGDIGGTLERARLYLSPRRPLSGRGGARPARATLPPALADGHVDAAMFFSPRTARIFAEHVRAAGLERHVARSVAFCLSEAVAEAARLLPWRATPVATETTRESMLALVDASV